MNTFRRCLACILIVSTFGLGMPLSASAGIVPTDQIYSASARGQIKNFLDRADVQARMRALGVDANAARARVDALTDEEAARLANRIDQLPAGGDAAVGVIGILFAVFIILLITDILGLTKVFPFTRSVR